MKKGRNIKRRDMNKRSKRKENGNIKGKRKQKSKEEHNPTTHEIQILVSMNKVLLEYNLTY